MSRLLKALAYFLQEIMKVVEGSSSVGIPMGTTDLIYHLEHQ
ncbi:MAG: hypothetical protein WBE68_01525 [Candidatus Nitrosopolaris sp.]